MNPEMFSERNDLGQFLDSQLSAIGNELRMADLNLFKANSPEEIYDSFYSKYSFPPLALEGALYQDANIKPVVQRDVEEGEFGAFEYEYSLVTVFQNIDGPVHLLRYPVLTVHPSPKGRIDGGKRRLAYEFRVTHDGDKSRSAERASSKLKDIERSIFALSGVLDRINNRLNQYHNQLKNLLQKTIRYRADLVDANEALQGILEIPVISRSGPLQYVDIPIESRLVMPIKGEGNQETERVYQISEDAFVFILDSIRHMCITMEQNSLAFQKLEEEQLRDVILAGLNGAFKGAAVGERFLKELPTDITIEAENREVFISECKIWSGISSLKQVLQQLHKRATWRDCKQAIVLFSKGRKKFTSLFPKIDEFLSKNGYQPVASWTRPALNEWRVQGPLGAKSEGDTIHIFLFDLS